MISLFIFLQTQPITLSPSIVNVLLGAMTTFVTFTSAAIVKLFVDYVKHRKDYMLHKQEIEQEVEQLEIVVVSNLKNYTEDKVDLKHVLDSFQKELHKHALDSQKMNGELKTQIAGIDGKLEILLGKKNK